MTWAWVQVDTRMSTNRKTYVLADLLAGANNDLFQRSAADWRGRAISLLLDVWGYAADHHPDGDLTEAHVQALTDRVGHWLEGTAWAMTDPRKLLERSGHVRVTRRARIVLNDWYEYSGATLARLAQDRERKRLTRGQQSAGASADSPRPRRSKQSKAKQSEVELSKAKLETAAAAGPTYTIRCVAALNAGIQRNPLVRNPTTIVAATEDGSVTWERDGIPLALAERVLQERAAIYRPRGQSRQPNRLAYFDAAVREAWDRTRAPQADPSSGAQLVDRGDGTMIIRV